MKKLMKNADRAGAAVLLAAALLMDGLGETAEGLAALTGLVALAGMLILLGNRAQERGGRQVAKRAAGTPAFRYVNWTPYRGTGPVAENRRADDLEMSRRVAYRYRWTAPGRARVFHPVYGETTVPCRSKYAAILCAAEVWKCDWTEIREAEVFAI